MTETVALSIVCAVLGAVVGAWAAKAWMDGAALAERDFAEHRQRQQVAFMIELLARKHAKDGDLRGAIALRGALVRVQSDDIGGDRG